MYILFHSTFKKKFDKIPKKIQERFYERLELFCVDKFASTLRNHPVGKTFPECRSINITGDYRAIFKEGDDEVVFITIGTHSELYS